MWHGYVGIENLALNAQQKTALLNAVRALGDNTSPLPNYRNHERIRLDNNAVIFEALFKEDDITVPKVKQWLGTIFSVNPNTISHTLSVHSFGGGSTPVATFTHNSTDYLRIAIFGGITTYGISYSECLGYINLNKAAWITPEV